MRTTEDTRAFFIVEMGSGTMLGGAKVGKTKLRSIFWQDNDTVVPFNQRVAFLRAHNPPD